jgi:hypothetical protein
MKSLIVRSNWTDSRRAPVDAGAGTTANYFRRTECVVVRDVFLAMSVPVTVVPATPT